MQIRLVRDRDSHRTVSDNCLKRCSALLGPYVRDDMELLDLRSLCKFSRKLRQGPQLVVGHKVGLTEYSLPNRAAEAEEDTAQGPMVCSLTGRDVNGAPKFSATCKLLCAFLARLHRIDARLCFSEA